MRLNLSKDTTFYERTDIRKEIVIQRLQERGYRITKQRKVILDIILEQNCTSCKEMYYKANAIEPSIGVATVYRTVNLLEEIGAFNRKNMYKISCCMDCDKENACMIQFEDNTVCQLTARNWYKVISEGLKVCGYGNGKKIKCVVAQSCTNEFC